MNEAHDILNAEEMRQCYGSFYSSSPRVQLDSSSIPERFWPLIPYAEFWGVADDWTRERLVKDAPADVQRNLKAAVAAYDRALEEWLTGPEADNPSPSDEYVAFAAMIMAADYI